MDENKEKMTPVQLVVVIFTVICFFVLILLGTLMLGGIFDEEKAEIWNGVFWIIITFAQLLLACGNWKKQKVTSTVQIGIWSFFLGAFVFRLVSTLMK